MDNYRTNSKGKIVNKNKNKNKKYIYIIYYHSSIYLLININYY